MSSTAIVLSPLPDFAYVAAMNRFNPPADLPLAGKIFFWVAFIIVMAAFSYFAIPILDQYVALPFSEWVGNTLFGPEPSAPASQ
ncbi:MAG: hypothetical protein K5872_06595 [Rhizobiaceae bacterium]|nr:hypothetical protein [Rhizobiaceae bacterium]MCV0405881.1 hypothetical protein [Rhizobiaceae bacterium]